LNRYLAALEKRQMLRTYFGGLTSGRLARLPFLGFWVLLLVLLLLYGLGIAFGIGVVEPLVFEGFEGFEGAQVYLLANFGLTVLAALGLFCLAFGFAKLNLIAKRIRDMGLPGWFMLLVLALTSASLGYALPPGGSPTDLGNLVNGGFYGILLLALLLIPSGWFARPAPTAAPVPSADHREGDGDGPGEGEADAQGAHQGVAGTAIDPAADQAIDQKKDQDGRNDDDKEKELAEIQRDGAHQ
jgi:uncharacterized membrane protein YhaH (DUF805 family)